MEKIYLINEIKELGDSALDNEGIVLALAKRENYYEIVKYASNRLKNDKDFMLEIFKLSEDYSLVQYSGDTLKNDKDFMLRAINLAPIRDVVKYASRPLKSDKDFMLRAIKLSPTKDLARYASQPLKSDKDFIIKAIGFDYKSYFYASEELKNDKEIAMAAINQNSDMANHITGYLEYDNDIIVSKIIATPSIEEKSIAKRNKFLIPIQVFMLSFGLIFIFFEYCRTDSPLDTQLQFISKTGCIIFAFFIICSMILCMCYPKDNYGAASLLTGFFALLGLGFIFFDGFIIFGGGGNNAMFLMIGDFSLLLGAIWHNLIFLYG